ncbi:MAG: hypothetical protein NXI27_21090 [Alphaproteobacteria bacterium]|nr:hypothetical protein [Alphaproteobacteria bacterium]
MSEIHRRLDRMESDLMDRLSILEAPLTHQVSVLQRPTGNDTPLQLPVLAALHRSHAPYRMTVNTDRAEAYEQIRKKWQLN